MKFLIIADAFPPMLTSAAVMMDQLAREMHRQGHQITVLIPSSSIKQPVEVRFEDCYKLISVRTPKIKDISYARRLVSELVTPYLIYFRIRPLPLMNEPHDGIIWYSPSIFFGPLIRRLKVMYGCSTYLVLRDIFPDWAVDLGIMKKRLLYYGLKLIEFYQYTVADHIGIQAPGNFYYFDNKFFGLIRPKVELLWNWISNGNPNQSCSINLNNTKLARRVIFVYAGNMGVAQNFDLIMDLVKEYKSNIEVGFVFVGRGSAVPSLQFVAEKHRLDNIIFFDEIDTSQIASLYAQCHVGIVALDPRHTSNNIPGKFLSYIDSGLPVLARLNPGNDLALLISENQIGVSYDGTELAEFKAMAEALLESLKQDDDMPLRCKKLARTFFSTKRASDQIIDALSKGVKRY